MSIALPLVAALFLAAPAKAPASAAKQDCAKNLNCLSMAARTCAPATATHELVLRMMGVEQRSSNKYEITGRDGKNCIFVTTQLSVSTKLDAKTREALMKKGKTLAEIDKAERGGGAAPVTRTCKVPPEQLANAITRWNNGAFSSDDLQNCK